MGRLPYTAPMKRLLALLVIVTLVSCSSTVFPKYSALVNQGILPLSTSNAYLGANLFISEEASRSRQLYNFLAARGGPTAIELTEEGGHPPHLLMFYPRDKEVFAAELTDLEAQNGLRFREWVIRGPYSIDRKDYRQLARLEGSFAGEPVFMISGREHRFRFQPPDADEQIKTVLVPVLPTPKPTPKPKKPKVIVQKGEEKPKAEDFKPLNADQQAIRMAQGYVERAENGDAIHTVTSVNETLKEIAKWYTGNELNLIAIAATNQISQPDAPLIPGARIRIPIASLATEKRMPSGGAHPSGSAPSSASAPSLGDHAPSGGH